MIDMKWFWNKKHLLDGFKNWDKAHLIRKEYSCRWLTFTVTSWCGFCITQYGFFPPSANIGIGTAEEALEEGRVLCPDCLSHL